MRNSPSSSKDTSINIEEEFKSLDKPVRYKNTVVDNSKLLALKSNVLSVIFDCLTLREQLSFRRASSRANDEVLSYLQRKQVPYLKEKTQEDAAAVYDTDEWNLNEAYRTVELITKNRKAPSQKVFRKIMSIYEEDNIEGKFARYLALCFCSIFKKITYDQETTNTMINVIWEAHHEEICSLLTSKPWEILPLPEPVLRFCTTMTARAYYLCPREWDKWKYDHFLKETWNYIHSLVDVQSTSQGDFALSLLYEAGRSRDLKIITKLLKIHA